MAIINEGRILMTGNPLEAIANLKGKIWQKRLTKDELDTYKERFNVISEKLIAGQPEIHVLGDSNPGNGFEPVSPDLEDVYFSYIFGKPAVELMN
jgi:hypothetical protein